MIIENSKSIVRFRLVGLAMSIVFVLIIAGILVTGFNNDKYFGFSKYYYAFVLGSIYVLYSIYVLIINRCYFHFSDEDEKLEFKYYSTNPFSFKNHYIVIGKNSLLRYEMKKFLGVKYDLILFQKSSRGEARYPGISLSALTNEEINLLKSILDKYASA